MLCQSQVENVFSMQCFNPNGLSGIQLKQIKLKAKPRNRKFTSGLFFENSLLRENRITLPTTSAITTSENLIHEYRAVEVIQKLSPGYYLEHPDPADNAQILRLQQTAYINLKIETPVEMVGYFKFTIRMKLLERFHFGKCLKVDFYINSGNTHEDENVTSRTIENPNEFFGTNFPIDEWFEWTLAETQVKNRRDIFICKIYCQNDRSWKSGMEFSTINVYRKY